jgi:hypothetical protein
MQTQRHSSIIVNYENSREMMNRLRSFSPLIDISQPGILLYTQLKLRIVESEKGAVKYGEIFY